LLYIGQTKTTFADRIINGHADFHELSRPEFQNINIYVGRLAGYIKIEDDEWNTQIDFVEKTSNLCTYSTAQCFRCQMD
jgi:hypothetical protein